MAKYSVSHPGFYWFSLLSLAILLVLSGLLMSGLFFSDYYSKKFKEEIRLLAELNSDISESQITDLTEELDGRQGIKPGSVNFVSRDEALTEMYGLLGDDVTLGDIENPFSDMIEFSIVAESFTEEYVSALSSTLEGLPEVVQVHYPKDYFDNVFGVIHTARLYLGIFILIALGMTAILIHHIMRLNILAQRTQIRTMELIGAKPGFIRKPFLRRGARMGFQSWLIATGLSAVAWLILLGPGMFLQWAFSVPGLVGSLTLLVLAIGVCVASTWIAVTKSLGASIMQSS